MRAFVPLPGDTRDERVNCENCALWHQFPNKKQYGRCFAPQTTNGSRVRYKTATCRYSERRNNGSTNHTA